MAVTLTLDVTELQAAAKRAHEELGPVAVSQALGVAVGRTKPFAIDVVAEQVSAMYNISGDEVKSSNTKGNAVDVGLRVGSDSGAIAAITFMGRVLTLAHFEFAPHSPPRGKYTVTGTIKSGQTKPLGGSNVFVPRSGAITKIPFKRTGNATKATKRTTHASAIEAIRTVSIPQMVSNEQLEEPIREAITQRLIEEFAQQFDNT